MDLAMPGIDGLEATRRVRALETAAGARPTPIVALTAGVLEDERRFSAGSGFDAFLVKPFNFDDLARTIERLCGPGGSPPKGFSQAS
jgi:CheY-like chemotaxis protein